MLNNKQIIFKLLWWPHWHRFLNQHFCQRLSKSNWFFSFQKFGIKKLKKKKRKLEFFLYFTRSKCSKTKQILVFIERSHHLWLEKNEKKIFFHKHKKQHENLRLRLVLRFLQEQMSACRTALPAIFLSLHCPKSSRQNYSKNNQFHQIKERHARVTAVTGNLQIFTLLL